MRILFDNGSPRGVAHGLSGHTVEDCRSHGWVTPNVNSRGSGRYTGRGPPAGAVVSARLPARSVGRP